MLRAPVAEARRTQVPARRRATPESGLAAGHAQAGAGSRSEVADQAAAGELRVPVTATFPLEQAPEAFDAFSAGTLGKITVTCV
ncbi:zinc-binding dehydrogenase [Streptomyces sp. NPDC057456]|uniref:zinc-binding dehydrogenase n=1 Tax=Streptomyces sp. NPDC057456 TaxID=3346139 RepID=UPI00368B99BC